MNPCLVDLFNNTEKIDKFAKWLPTMFDIVRHQVPEGNPAVGILREHVIIGFFVSEFGEKNVDVPTYGNKRSLAMELCGHKLSIKTRTGKGTIKAIWTSDTEKVEEEINEVYEPQHDILLIRIYWDEKMDSVFYIPLFVQESVLDTIGRSEYLKSATGTNNRGIEISAKALSLLEKHNQTMSFKVDWRTTNGNYPPPWERWCACWQNCK